MPLSAVGGRSAKSFRDSVDGATLVEGDGAGLTEEITLDEVDPHLLRALVGVESSGRADVRSGAGAVGLCQLMPATAKEQAFRLSARERAETEQLREAAKPRSHRRDDAE